MYENPIREFFRQVLNEGKHLKVVFLISASLGVIGGYLYSAGNPYFSWSQAVPNIIVGAIVGMVIALFILMIVSDNFKL